MAPNGQSYRPNLRRGIGVRVKGAAGRDTVVAQWGKLFCLQLELFLLTVKLLCLQSLEALIRRVFPLQTKKLQL